MFFVVDRKDLDYQTMKEYQRFSPDSVNGSNNTAGTPIFPENALGAETTASVFSRELHSYVITDAIRAP